MGRFVSADTIVPDPVNPQQFNRFAFVTNNPLKYIDPTGHCGEGSTLGEGVSQEHHDLLCKLHDEALRLSELVQKGKLTDVEALAMLLDFAAPLYPQPRPPARGGGRGGIPVRAHNTNDFVYDLGIVVGGLDAREPLNPRLIVDPDAPGGNGDDPLGQYYVGYAAFDTDLPIFTAFASEFAEPGENQVRHFAGGLAGGRVHEVVGRAVLLLREPGGRDSPDYKLHLKAFELADALKTTRVNINEAGNWVLKNLGNWRVRGSKD